MKQDQRYIAQVKNTSEGASLYHADTASITFYNAAIGASIAKIGVVAPSISADTSNITLDTELGNAKGTPYMLFQAVQDYTFIFYDGDDKVLATTVLNAQPMSRYTAVLFGGSTLQARIYTDD